MKKLTGFWEKYKYLGYTKKTIDDIRVRIDEDNIRIAGHVSLLLILIMFILLAFYTLFDFDWLRNSICLAAGGGILAVYKISKQISDKRIAYSRLKIDLLINILMAISFLSAIYLGTFAAGDEMAVAPIWMFFFAILIFNRLPAQNLVVIIITFGIFLVCSYMTKSSRNFQYDIMHSLTSVIASISMSWEKSRIKVENILALEKLKRMNQEILETVEEQEKEAKLLRHKARCDEATGFYKKDVFEEKVKKILKNSPPDAKHAFICIDIDNFKGINDNLGHLYGDVVIKSIAYLIKEQVDEKDILCRFGGDEFCIFCPDISSEQDIQNRVKNILVKCRQECRQGEKCQKVSLSIGGAFSRERDETYKKLFQRADQALYCSKNEGKSTFRFL